VMRGTIEEVTVRHHRLVQTIANPPRASVAPTGPFELPKVSAPVGASTSPLTGFAAETGSAQPQISLAFAPNLGSR
jgi:hypothetical protein